MKTQILKIGVLFVASLVSLQALAQNLVNNPGFESGMTDWANWGGSAAVTGQAYAGTRSIRTGPGAGGVGQNVLSRLTAGKSYRLQAYARRSASSDWAGVGIKFTSSSGAVLLDKSAVVTSASYTLLTVDFVAPSGATAANVYTWKNGTASYLDVDQFNLVATTTTATPVPTATIKIMPLGDSITFGIGSVNRDSYRKPLYTRLKAAGYNVDFVGARTSGVFADTNNEGHSYYRIGDILGLADTVIDRYQPHIVLIHIGTNDMWQNGDEKSLAPGRLRELIQRIAKRSPRTRMIVAQIIPFSNATNDNNVVAYNASVKTVVDSEKAAGRNVVMVNMHSALNASTDLADGTHPNDTGYAKMANVWYPAVVSQINALGGNFNLGTALAKNDVLNNGFESGLTSWTKWAGTASIGTVAGAGPTANAALKISGTSGGLHQYLNVAKLVPNSLYSICASGKVAAGEKGVFGLRTASGFQLEIAFTSTSYTYNCAHGRLPANVSGAYVYASKSAGVGAYYVDNLSASGQQNYLYNPGFESDLAPGSYWATSGSTRLSGSNDGNQKTGHFAMVIGTAAGVRKQTNTLYRSGGLYSLCAWGRVRANGETGKVVANFGSGSTPTLTFNTTTYTYKCLQMTAPSTATTVTISVQKDAGIGSYFFADDVTVFAN
ncbi:MAG: GDSL-type esterase/lipase family protein [Pseudobdellovibrionaceae bacterium]